MSQLSRAYILQIKPFKETSAIARVLSENHGQLSLVIKGVFAKNRRGQQLRAGLQAGNLTEIQWIGQSSLKNALSVDTLNSLASLSTKEFLCLSYIHEILLKLIPEEQACEEIFYLYEILHKQIVSSDNLEYLLRSFELQLFDFLGYGIDFLTEVHSQEPISPENTYTYKAEFGIVHAETNDTLRINFDQLHQIAAKDLNDTNTLSLLKRIIRLQLNQLLEGRTLKTRKLYNDML